MSRIESYEDFLRRYLPKDAERLLIEEDPSYEPGAAEAVRALERSMACFAQNESQTQQGPAAPS